MKSVVSRRTRMYLWKLNPPCAQIRNAGSCLGRNSCLLPTEVKSHVDHRKFFSKLRVPRAGHAAADNLTATNKQLVILDPKSSSKNGIKLYKILLIFLVSLPCSSACRAKAPNHRVPETSLVQDNLDNDPIPCMTGRRIYVPGFLSANCPRHI